MWQPGVTLEEVERDVILKALRFYSLNRAKTAVALGVSRRTIDNKLAKYKGEESGKPLYLEGRTHLESAKESAKERTMSVRQPEEVQEVPPSDDATGST